MAMTKEKLKYEAPSLTSVVFRAEMGYAASFNEFQVINQLMPEDLASMDVRNEFNAGQFTNVDQTQPSGNWVYTEQGTWF